MNRKVVRYFVQLVLLCWIPFLGLAQTGINTHNVSANVALQIDAGQNNGGFLLPRLTTAQRDQMDLTSAHNGLMIFNLDESCINYYLADLKEWQSVCGQPSNAEFTITNCGEISVNGIYTQDENLFTDHYITLEIEVQKPGNYNIVASSNQGNGYYFQTSGKFLNKGKITVKVPGYGTPISSQIDTFNLLLNGQDSNGSDPGCSFTVEVMDKDILPLYSMVCKSVAVHGTYKLHENLDNTNYIKVTLDVEPEAIGATYEIQTDEVDGISFKGTGTLHSYTQEVILYARGSSFSIENKVFTLTSNSLKTTTTCQVELYMVIPKKKLLTIGSDPDGYGYNFSGKSLSNKLITEPRNYGTLPNSKVYFDGWSEIYSMIPETYSIAALRNYLLGPEPVDVLILGFAYPFEPEAGKVVVEYLKRGGVALIFCQEKVGLQSFFRELTQDNTVSVVDGGGAGSVYRFNYIDDEILNGPFGDIRGRYWGEDISITMLTKGLPESDFVFYAGSYNNSQNSLTGFLNESLPSAGRHKKLNLIWVGDGGFNSSCEGLPQNTRCPFVLDGNNLPIPKPDYGDHLTNRLTIDNSSFTANAIAWAIYQSEVNGINSSL